MNLETERKIIEESNKRRGIKSKWKENRYPMWTKKEKEKEGA